MSVPAPDSTEYWSERSRLDPLAAVLDPGAAGDGKNAQIDRMHRLALRRVLAGQRARSVLDFGCGTGRMSRAVAWFADLVTAIDTSREWSERAREPNTDPRVDFTTYDGHVLPFDDASFDTVVSVVVLQLYRDTVARFRSIAQELARVLRPAGRAWFIEQAAPLDAGGAWSPERWRAELATAGLDLRRVRPVRHFQHSPVFRLALTGRVPKPWLEVAARVDLALTVRAGLREPYTECLMSIVRR